MIGLGSNRLTCCRRGGMSVTQAGRGGMEWLAGGRWPSWASPYSAQATAALKDAFTAAQWATIRDYGFAHPEIVGYMNAYAPEDAKIAYSLVEGIGTRWIQGNGSAYISLPYAFNSISKYTLQCEQLLSEESWILGCANRTGLMLWDGTMYSYFQDQYTDNGAYPTSSATTIEYTPTSLKIGSNTTTPRNYSTETATIYLFYGGDNYSKSRSKVTEVNGDNTFRLVPYIKNGQKGLLNLLDGTFYGDATGNNGFTISETPAS